MKGKNLLGALLMALLGGLISLVVYTRVIDKPEPVMLKGKGNEQISEASPVLTSYQGPGSQVDLTYAAELAVHAVVHVRTTSMISGQYDNPVLEWFYGDNIRRQPREVTGYGSGVIVSADGYIITNNHVIEDAEDVSVKLNDNREFKAQVIGRDPSTDIAVVKIKAEDLPFLKYGNSDELRLGEWVLAVGNPFNLTSTVTAGIVSAKGRSIGILDDNYKIESFIQTDAALNRGNSGGALVNTRGLLVGITSAIISPNGSYSGNSFAIPVSLVKKVVDDLIQYGEVQRAIIGVRILDVTSDLVEKENLKLNEIKGVYISEVIDGGSAEEAGLKSKDVVVRFNNVPVSTMAELQLQIGKYRPGDKAEITYNRGGREVTVPITLKNIDNNTKIVKAGEGGGAILGARLEPVTADEMKNFRIDYGVRVTDVSEGKLKDLGIKKGYIILTLNGKRVKTTSDVRDITNNGQSLTAIEGIQSNGTYFSYTFKR
ncbi:MAG: Do family serine endopeptidase [Bacteroidales bacterium]